VSFETTAGQGTTFHIRLPIDGGQLVAPKQAAWWRPCERPRRARASRR
jgi:hypothetical protein